MPHLCQIVVIVTTKTYLRSGTATSVRIVVSIVITILNFIVTLAPRTQGTAYFHRPSLVTTIAIPKVCTIDKEGYVHCRRAISRHILHLIHTFLVGFQFPLRVFRPLGISQLYLSTNICQIVGAAPKIDVSIASILRSPIYFSCIKVQIVTFIIRVA